MMKIRKRFIYSVLVLLFLSTHAISQQNIELLESVLKNNLTLKQVELNAEYQSLNGYVGIAPQGLEIGAGYFPGTGSVVKNTFEVTQRFDFPTIYKKKLDVAESNKNIQNLGLVQYKMNLLVHVQQIAIDYVFTKRSLDTLKIRLQDAENLLNAFTRMFEQGDANLLEVNKIKLNLVRIQESYSSTSRKFNNLSYQLVQLNGGEEVKFNAIDYPKDFLIDSAEYFSKLSEVDPEIIYSKANEQLMQSKLKVAKHQNLPGFLLGYGYEGTDNETFSGVRFGIHIPLWQNAKKTENAKVGVMLSEQNTEAVSYVIQNQTIQLFESYKQLTKSVENYKTTLNELKSAELLKKSLEFGHISLIEYLLELTYLYEATDKLMNLEMEKSKTLVILSKYQYLELLSN